jgi:hypothetical protein
MSNNLEFMLKMAWTNKHVRKDGSHEREQIELPNFPKNLTLEALQKMKENILNGEKIAPVGGVVANPWNEEKQCFDIVKVENIADV